MSEERPWGVPISVERREVWVDALCEVQDEFDRLNSLKGDRYDIRWRLLGNFLRRNLEVLSLHGRIQRKGPLTPDRDVSQPEEGSAL